MFALNFESPYHEPLLLSRTKNCTIRLGDISDSYPKGSIVWITYGERFAAKKKLYPAILDKVSVKKFSQLNTGDLDHQNPDIKSVDELIAFFEKMYNRSITPNDIVTAIYFSEIIES